MKKPSQNPIDALGFLKAQIADLQEQEKKLKNEIIAGYGAGTHSGQLFDASVSFTTRETLDMDAVRAHVSRQFIAANTKVSESTVVRVSARKLVKEAA